MRDPITAEHVSLTTPSADMNRGAGRRLAGALICSDGVRDELDGLRFGWTAASRAAHVPGCGLLKGRDVRWGDWRTAALGLRRPCRLCAGRHYTRLLDRFHDAVVVALSRHPVALAIPDEMSDRDIHVEATAARMKAFESVERVELGDGSECQCGLDAHGECQCGDTQEADLPW